LLRLILGITGRFILNREWSKTKETSTQKSHQESKHKDTAIVKNDKTKAKTAKLSGERVSSFNEKSYKVRVSIYGFFAVY